MCIAFSQRAREMRGRKSERERIAIHTPVIGEWAC